LGDRVGPVKQKNRYLFVNLASDVDTTVEMFVRLVPVHLSRSQLDAFTRAPIAELDFKYITTQDNRDTMVRVAMPGHRFARREHEPANQGCASLKNYIVGH
jgi:hypothetical protein